MDKTDYTLLPFLDVITAAKLFLFFAALILLTAVIRKIVFKRSLSLHKAHASIAFSLVTASLANMLFTTFLYWYWALPLSIAISVIYAFTTAGDVKDANSEERIGVWGLNEDIRRVRGEIFNDMTVEEQIAYRGKVKETRFSKTLFIIISLAAAAVIVLLFNALDIGYLFSPVPIE